MTKQTAYFASIALLLGAFGFFIQTMMFLSGDVGSLLYDTRLFLAGGNYVSDFFETNPPMIFLLYAPVIFISKWSSLNIIFCVRAYTILFGLLSTVCSAYLLKKILNNKEIYLYYLILFSLLFCFIFLPICEFGQREHLYTMLMAPYIFNAVLRAQQKKIPLLFSIFIGILAALATGMKPYFLAPLVLIELYLMIKKRAILSVFSIAPMMVLFLLIVYLAWVGLRFPNYFNIMMPLISHLYYVGIKVPWADFFAHLPVVFVIFVALINLPYINKITQHRDLIFILQLTLIGMIIAFTIPRAPWYYHLFPAITFACLFANVCLYEFFLKHPGFFNIKNIFLSLIVTFAVPYFCFTLGTIYAINIKRHSDINQVVSFINALPVAPTVYCFSSNSTGDCFTLMYLTHSQYGGRYPFFWWVKGLRTLEQQAHGKPLPAPIQKDKTYLINIFADDLNHFKPDYFIINNYAAKDARERFVNYFSPNKKFDQAWRSYRYLKTIHSYEIYQRV